MKKNLWKIIGTLSLVATSAFIFSKKIFAAEDEFRGAEFDPEGKIEDATGLTTASPVQITVNTIKWALSFLGLVAVVMIIWGGFMWMTSAGNEERVRKAKDILKAAIIGMIVVLISWVLVLFVFTQTRELSS